MQKNPILERVQDNKEVIRIGGAWAVDWRDVAKYDCAGGAMTMILKGGTRIHSNLRNNGAVTFNDENKAITFSASSVLVLHMGDSESGSIVLDSMRSIKGAVCNAK